MAEQRLQKVMAEAGVASRRQCEQMILDGKVRVNGRVVNQLPVLVDPDRDSITLGRKRLRFDRKVYFLLNKPKKVVCTNSDPQGRVRAIDLLEGVTERVYPVGRLDADSQGLLLLTNDGELANQLTHPKYGVIKTYIAEVDGPVDGEDVEALRKGIHLDQGKASMQNVTIVRRGPKRSLLEINLQEGQNRQIRRMLSRLGHKVRQLTRVRIGGLTLRGLGPGRFRPLTRGEVQKLRRMVARQSELVAQNTPSTSAAAAQRKAAARKGKRDAQVEPKGKGATKASSVTRTANPRKAKTTSKAERIPAQNKPAKNNTAAAPMTAEERARQQRIRRRIV